jgi:hypothetical protein
LPAPDGCVEMISSSVKHDYMRMLRGGVINLHKTYIPFEIESHR